MARRARIFLLCADGLSNQEVAEELGANRVTVGKSQQRFIERGLDGLVDSTRPGEPRRIVHKEIERLIARTLEETSKDATHWSTRSMAEATGLSRSSINRI